MRKTLALLLCITMLFLIACSIIDAPLNRQMTEYYLDDTHYQKATGTVEGIRYDNRHVGYLDIMIITENHGFPLYSNGIMDFSLYSNSDLLNHISTGDKITFISAPMQFYSGHRCPIIALEKEDEVLLSFEEGKADYLAWIQETFG